MTSIFRSGLHHRRCHCRCCCLYHRYWAHFTHRVVSNPIIAVPYELHYTHRFGCGFQIMTITYWTKFQMMNRCPITSNFTPYIGNLVPYTWIGKVPISHKIPFSHVNQNRRSRFWKLSIFYFDSPGWKMNIINYTFWTQ